MASCLTQNRSPNPYSDPQEPLTSVLHSFLWLPFSHALSCCWFTLLQPHWPRCSSLDTQICSHRTAFVLPIKHSPSFKMLKMKNSPDKREVLPRCESRHKILKVTIFPFMLFKALQFSMTIIYLFCN